MTLAKHWAAVLDDYVIDLAWSPDGTVLAAASAAGSLKLFDARTGAVRHTLPGHQDGTNCIAWMPSANLLADAGQPGSTKPAAILASGGQDGFVRYWDAVSGTQCAEAKLGSAWVEHLCWRPPATAGSGAPPPDADLLFAAAGRKLFALNADGTIAHAFPDAPKTIAALAARPDGSGCAAACFGSVCLWDAAGFGVQKEYSYGSAILALTWSPDGRWLVAGCQDNAVHLWAPAEDEELHMSGYEAKLQELSFSPDSKWLATGGGRDACVWDCSGAGPADREPLTLPHEARVCAVAFQHTHSQVATAATDGEFSLWAPARKNPLIAGAKLPSPASRFAWRSDDTLLAVGTESGTVFVFRTE